LRTEIKEFLEIAAYVIAMLAAVGSAWQYRRNSLRERARWLFELYQRLYEQRTLRAMRIRLDSHDTKFVSEESDLGLLADLDDFLNFFEFIAYLWKKRELQLEEVRALFAYPLRTIAEDEAVMAYVSKYGYDDDLGALLKELGSHGKRESQNR
jgi:hypothetical protein